MKYEVLTYYACMYLYQVSGLSIRRIRAFKIEALCIRVRAHVHNAKVTLGGDRPVRHVMIKTDKLTKVDLAQRAIADPSRL